MAVFAPSRSLGGAAAAALALSVLAGPGPFAAPARADTAARPFVQAEQGLTEEERRRFYHLSIGSQLLPLAVLRALKDPATGKPFLEDPERFGMLSDPDDPDGLPIGLTQENGRGSSVLGPIAGINCAACHVTELRHGGRAVRIDGAASMMDFEKFGADLGAAIKALENPLALAGFLGRLVFQPASEEPMQPKTPRELTGLPGVNEQPEHPSFSRRLLSGLKEELEIWAQTKRLYVGKGAYLGKMGEMETAHPAGPGRTDDWVLARNLLFPKETWLKRGAASANYPVLWGYDGYEWLTWNGVTRSGMERGVATVMGLGALYDEQYESTISPAAIVEQDRIAAKIRPPEWPEDVLGPIDRAAAARGAEVYAAECARCHDEAAVYSYDEIGTDTTHADSYAIPVGAKTFAGAFSTATEPSFADAMSKEIARYTAEAYAQEGWSDAQIEAVAPTDKEVWAAARQIVSRPLDAVWASAPYLSNGAVPTIDALLRPAAERPKAFPIGHYDFDPVLMGFRTDIPQDQAVFWFDTGLEGNAATGHEFGTDMSDADRRALIEYLKTR